MDNLKVYLCHNDAILPFFATEQSACFDICCCLKNRNDISVHAQDGQSRNYCFSEDKKAFIRLHPKEWVAVPTGLMFDIPEGHSVRLHPRSGLALKNGISFMNCEGIIDADYVEEVKAIIVNHGHDVFKISHGDRICQGELVKNTPFVLEHTTERPKKKSNRDGGFGSTGVK